MIGLLVLPLLVWALNDQITSRDKMCCDKLLGLVKFARLIFWLSHQRLKVANIDHCHETGKFRGFLCNQYNVALGNIMYVTAL